jgi:nicotinamide-nucleotide amidase
VPISTTILAVLGQIELHLTARAGTRPEADAVLDVAVRELQDALDQSVYSADGRGLEVVVGDLLRERRLTVAVAESCTGGLLASRLTDVPGSSEYVDRGVVCYSNRAKTELAGVPDELIREHGAVSEAVAESLADGIRSRAGTHVGIGITGIAGPGGGTPEKPVGTVCIAVVVRAGEGASAENDARWIRTFAFFGGRDMVKFQATQAAMNMLRLTLLRSQV